MTLGAPAPLEEVLATGELVQRASRPPEFEQENRALLQLVGELGHPSTHVLQRVADTVLELCRAGSAGISILEHRATKPHFRWHAVSGALRAELWHVEPEHESPSGVAFQRDALQLFTHPERRFRYLAEVRPMIREMLVSPYSIDGRAVGTVWAAMHDEDLRFDAEDARLIATLSGVVAAGYQAHCLVELMRESNRNKDEFLAVLSHELRNPLAAMSNSVRYLAHPAALEAERDRARDVIQRQLAQVIRLSEDLLDVSRIGHGTLELRLERTDLVNVVRTARESAAPALAESGREVNTTLPTAPLWIEGDAARLSQLVVNLLTNVARQTPTGGKVTLTLEREGGTAVLLVAGESDGLTSDWGRSPPDPFAPPGHQRSPALRGIGVALALSLAELHGARVATVSTGGGHDNGIETRFALLDAAEHADAERTDRRRERQPVREMRRREKVLIVDDSVDSSDSLAMLLRSWGHEVRTAQGAVAGLRVESEFEPHAVILDIEMPGKNGYEVAAELRVRRRRDLLLVALSGHAREEDRTRSLEAGFDHHLTKPANLEMLRRLLS